MLWEITIYMEEKKEGPKILESHTKQLNTYGNGIGVLVSREAKSIGLKSGDKVHVTSYEEGDEKFIKIEKFENLDKESDSINNSSL